VKFNTVKAKLPFVHILITVEQLQCLYFDHAFSVKWCNCYNVRILCV